MFLKKSMLALRTSNFHEATIRPIVPRRKLVIVVNVPHYSHCIYNKPVARVRLKFKALEA